MNNYLHHIRCVLLQEDRRRELATSLSVDEEIYNWVDSDSGEPQYMGNIIGDFAGQARFHWHYGVSSSIVAGIEAHVGSVGRGWLRDDVPTRRALLCESSSAGIFWVDIFGIWQMFLAITYVAGTAAGAMWISYWTPTVGVGCHTGGYLVFVVLSALLFIYEISLWWLLPRNSKARRLASATIVVGESINSTWLLYITLAKTFQLYESCDCLGAAWDPISGGYINFSELSYTEKSQVYSYWLSGTLFACIVLTWGTGFVVMRWCEQSHLTTLNYDSALQGLMWTRRFTNATKFIRWIPELTARLVSSVVEKVFRKPIQPLSMVWTRNRAMVSGDALVMVDSEESRNIGGLRCCSSTTRVAGSSSASDERLEVLEERDEK